MLLGFGQVVHDPFPDYIPRQWLTPAALFGRLRRLLYLVRILVSVRLRVFFPLPDRWPSRAFRPRPVALSRVAHFCDYAARREVRAAGCGICSSRNSRAEAVRTAPP